MAEYDLTLEGLIHDLRNVFETIGDGADLLANDPKHARLAATLCRSVERGARILSSFVEQSQAALDLELIVDHSIVFTCDFLNAVKATPIEFVRGIPADLRLRASAAAWERVFVNLFLNAAQAMPSGGTVEIHAAREDGGVVITVADDGPGIAPQNLERIFQPGFTTRAERSGLGLQIVQSVVERNGGTVTASNRPAGGGAQFRICLPMAAAEGTD